MSNPDVTQNSGTKNRSPNIDNVKIHFNRSKYDTLEPIYLKLDNY